MLEAGWASPCWKLRSLLRAAGQLAAMASTHVDDLLVASNASVQEEEISWQNADHVQHKSESSENRCSFSFK